MLQMCSRASTVLSIHCRNKCVGFVSSNEGLNSQVGICFRFGGLNQQIYVTLQDPKQKEPIFLMLKSHVISPTLFKHWMKPFSMKKICRISKDYILCFAFTTKILSPSSVTLENAFLPFTAFGKFNFIEQSSSLLLQVVYQM